jgi:HSP20 family protein
MSTLIRWDPFRVQWNPLKERDELEHRLSTLLGHRASTGNGGKEALTVAEWSPLVDIVEDENEYRIKAELPAMKKEDVRLTVDNGVLTISGERKYEQEEKREKHHRIERAYGEFRPQLLTPGGCGREQGHSRLQRRGAPHASPEIRESKTEIDRDQGVLASCR